MQSVFIVIGTFMYFVTSKSSRNITVSNKLHCCLVYWWFILLFCSDNNMLFAMFMY